ncbi:solute carrier family 25 [Vigna unguiculata]|uniref:Solute carrier family 25 n=1 Tax=Vigna unguiculata TaxID=3917 RepID=A0A4D6M6F1_VIGUN|nr:solute carrier family 25 [Vigna unguiculata]
MIPSPSESRKIELCSLAFYAACTAGGIDPSKYKNITSGFGVLLKEQGFRGFFRGWMCIRDRGTVSKQGRHPTTEKSPEALLLKPVSYTHLDVYKRQRHCKQARSTLLSTRTSRLDLGFCLRSRASGDFSVVGPEYASKYKTLIYLAGFASAEVIADVALCPFEAVKVRIKTQPGFVRGLADGLPKFVRSEGTLGYAYKVSAEISPPIMKFLKIFKSKLFNLRTFNSLSLPTTVTPITESKLLNSIESSQWHFIKQAAPHYTPSLLSSTLTSLRHKPQLVLQLLSHLNDHPHSLNVTNSSLAACILCRLPSPKPSINLLQSLIICSTATNRTIFHELELSRDRVDSKTSLIFDLLVRAYCELKKPNEALECFYLMKEKGVEPNIETCNQMLSLFLRLNRTHMAWVLYAEMFRMKIKSSVYTFNIMVNVLCKEGKLKKAKEFIGYMEALGVKPNVVTYNTVIHGHCLRGKFQMARVIFQTMKDEGLEPDCYTYNSFISGLCKERRLEEASGLHCKMLEIGLVPKAVTYNALIDGYCNKGDLDKAFACRDEMISKGVMTTLVTYNLFIHALFMEGRMGEADNMIKEMREKGMKPDAVTYNILINGYCRCGDAKRAFSLLDEMVGKGIRPTLVTDSCREGKVAEARQLLDEMKRRGIKPDHISYNTLISGYSKRGDMKDAFRVRDEMLTTGFDPTILTYNALIQGLCKNGEGEHAEELLKEMVSKGITPDDSTYLSIIEAMEKVDDLEENDDK